MITIVYILTGILLVELGALGGMMIQEHRDKKVRAEALDAYQASVINLRTAMDMLKKCDLMVEMAKEIAEKRGIVSPIQIKRV